MLGSNCCMSCTSSTYSVARSFKNDVKVHACIRQMELSSTHLNDNLNMWSCILSTFPRKLFEDNCLPLFLGQVKHFLWSWVQLVRRQKATLQRWVRDHGHNTRRIKVHTIDASGWVVLNAEVNVLVNAKPCRANFSGSNHVLLSPRHMLRLCNSRRYLHSTCVSLHNEIRSHAELQLSDKSYQNCHCLQSSSWGAHTPSLLGQPPAFPVFSAQGKLEISQKLLMRSRYAKEWSFTNRITFLSSTLK